jgi:hypothetical protein
VLGIPLNQSAPNLKASWHLSRIAACLGLGAATAKVVPRGGIHAAEGSVLHIFISVFSQSHVANPIEGKDCSVEAASGVRRQPSRKRLGLTVGLLGADSPASPA